MAAGASMVKARTMWRKNPVILCTPPPADTRELSQEVQIFEAQVGAFRAPVGCRGRRVDHGLETAKTCRRGLRHIEADIARLATRIGHEHVHLSAWEGADLRLRNQRLFDCPGSSPTRTFIFFPQHAPLFQTHS